MLLAKNSEAYLVLVDHPFYEKIYRNYIPGAANNVVVALEIRRLFFFSFLFFFTATLDLPDALTFLFMVSFLFATQIIRVRIMTSRESGKSPNCGRSGSNRLRANYRLTREFFVSREMRVRECARMCVSLKPKVRIWCARHLQLGAPHAPPHAASTLCFSGARCLARLRPMAISGFVMVISRLTKITRQRWRLQRRWR